MDSIRRTAVLVKAQPHQDIVATDDGGTISRAPSSTYGPFVVAPVWLLECPAISGDALKLWCHLARWMDLDQRVTMVDLREAMSASQQRINKLLTELEAAGAVGADAEQGYAVFYTTPRQNA